MSVMNTLIRRELWEHRAILLAPIAFGALFVIVDLLAALGVVKVQFGGHGELTGLVSSLDAHKAKGLLLLGLSLVAMWLNLVMLLVATFYLLDCLYAERKDRSVLFWKSLPVSDVTVVGSKLLTAAVAIPVVNLVVFIAVAFCIYVITGMTLSMAGSGHMLSAGPAALAEAALVNGYALLVQSLWYLPIAGWFLVVSAWARRAVLLWAVLPPVAIIVVEEIVLGTRHFAALMRERLIGVFPQAFTSDTGRHQLAWKYQDENANVDLQFSDGVLGIIDPGNILTSPGLWSGLIVAGLFFAAAVWMRRYRDDS